MDEILLDYSDEEVLQISGDNNATKTQLMVIDVCSSPKPNENDTNAEEHGSTYNYDDRYSDNDSDDHISAVNVKAMRKYQMKVKKKLQATMMKY